MDFEKYNYSADSLFLEYKFISEGPKGNIVKVVRYTRTEQDQNVFNLGFGDQNEISGYVDDSVVSNNNDREKVLTLVASTLIDFISQYPDCSVFAMGSTPSRTRLYQIGISMNLEKLAELFYIYGYTNEKWKIFDKKTNYEAFLVRLK